MVNTSTDLDAFRREARTWIESNLERRTTRSAASSAVEAVKPVTSVTTLPRFRFSIDSRKDCESGGVGGRAGGGHRQSASSAPQRSQRGGISNGVPANSRVMA